MLDMQDFILSFSDHTFYTSLAHNINRIAQDKHYKIFTIKDEGVAIVKLHKRYQWLKWIASKEKGVGTKLMNDVLNSKKPTLLYCRDTSTLFFKKFKFKTIFWLPTVFIMRHK